MAEFVEVMRQWNRMCDSTKYCGRCELDKMARPTVCVSYALGNAEKVEEVVMSWAAEHPEKTMKDVLFEKFPNAEKYPDGTPVICATDVGFDEPVSCGMLCSKCWSRPAPEE